MMGSRRKALLAAAALCGLAAVPALAISVSPLVLFLSARSPSSTLTLYNDNPLPEEISISTGFGYPESDSTGKVRVELRDTAPAGEPSATSWIRIFPRRLILQPGQRQVVRVIALPPADLPEGEYWARVLVSATGGRPPVEQEIRSDVKVAISLKTVFAAAVLYRKGAVRTGVAVRQAGATAANGGPVLTLDLERQGNAAFLGRVRLQLIGPDGKQLAEHSEPVSVYHALRRTFPVPAPEGADLHGTSIRYTLDTDRPDLGDALLKAAAVTGSVPVR